MTALTIEQVHALRSDITEEDIVSIKAEARSLLPLAALRESVGITQSEIAERLGKSQASISKFEGRGDFLLSTLYRHVCAIGGELTVSIKAGASKFELQAADFGDDVGFSLKRCAAKDIDDFLVENARQYSSIQARVRASFNRGWTRVRPVRRTAHDKALNQVLVEEA